MALDALPDPTPASPSEGVEHVTETRETTTPTLHASWLSGEIRNLVIIALTVILAYLVWIGERDAILVLLGTYPTLIGAKFGEKAALKKPGQDT